MSDPQDGTERTAREWWNSWANHFQSEYGDGEIPVGIAFGPGAEQGDDLGLLGDLDGKKVIELGCGGAQFGIAVSKRGADVTGVDISEEQLAFARTLADEHDQDIEFVESSVTEMPTVASETYDVAFSAFAFQWVRDLEACFAEAYRVLKEDGKLVFSVDHPYYKTLDAETGGFERSYFSDEPRRVYSEEFDAEAWEEVVGFRELRDRIDWGLDRHDGLAQIRSLRTHPDAPERLVAGVEVGGVHVSDDGGEDWQSRCIDCDAPHTDDIHHLALEDEGTIVASTGSGLYRSTDVGRTWTRLDGDHDQRYFRGAFVHDGTVYAGGAPASSSSWEEGNHALFASHDGKSLERISFPTSDEVAIGWCAVDGDVLTATHRGTLFRHRSGDWETVGSVPTPGRVRGRYMPLTWYEP